MAAAWVRAAEYRPGQSVLHARLKSLRPVCGNHLLTAIEIRDLRDDPIRRACAGCFLSKTVRRYLHREGFRLVGYPDPERPTNSDPLSPWQFAESYWIEPDPDGLGDSVGGVRIALAP